MRPWLVYSTEYQGRRKRREDSSVAPSFPLRPALRKASSSHSRGGGVPSRKFLKSWRNISHGFHGPRQHKKETGGHRIPNSGGCLACFYPRHLSEAVTVTLSSVPSARAQPSGLHSQPPQCPNTPSWIVSSMLSFSCQLPPHTKLHCARRLPGGVGTHRANC